MFGRVMRSWRLDENVAVMFQAFTIMINNNSCIVFDVV